MVASPARRNPGDVNRDVAPGWWRASDGYWYPPEAKPGQLWQGKVIGPHGEEPPGPGWWLASDYQWYPPDARPGELWAEPVAGIPGRLTAPAAPLLSTRAMADAKAAGRILGAAGGAMIVLSVALMWAVRHYLPEAGDTTRLLAWLPMAVGSSVAIVGALRYFGDS